MATSNSLTQVAQMYNLLEATLRKVAGTGQSLTIADISNADQIKELAKTKWQVRDLVMSLVRNSYVVESINDKNVKQFVWDVTAPPFTLTTQTTRKAATKPSVVTSTKPDGAVIQSLAKVAQEIEVQMGSVCVVIGRNPVTGRMRIIIEEEA